MSEYADTWDAAADMRWEPNSTDYREVAEVLRRLEAQNARLLAVRCPNTHMHRWDGDGMCKHCGNYATDLIDAALRAKQ